MSQVEKCTPSAKKGRAFLKCNFKEKEGLGMSRMVREGEMSHGETVASQDFWDGFTKR